MFVTLTFLVPLTSLVHEETYTVELVPCWNVRILTPNGNRTYYCRYEEKFTYEPNEQEIATVLAEHLVKGAFASVCKNYELVEKLKETKNEVG